MLDINQINKEYNEAKKKLFDRVYECLKELDEITTEYAKWDEWDKSKAIDNAKNAIIDGFEKEIMDKEENK